MKINKATIVQSLNGVKIELYKTKNLLSITIDTYKVENMDSLIQKKFLLKCDEFKMDITGEQMFKKCETENYTLSLGFGKWYPFSILSETEESNRFIEEIFEWLQTIDIPT